MSLGATLAKTVGHFWPEFRTWLNQVHDTRDPDRITYAGRFLIWMGLLIFLLKLGSRRRIGFDLDSPTALANLNRLAGCQQEAVAHPDTVNYFLGHVHPGEFHRLRRKGVHRLIRMKALDGGRLMGYFLVVFDGTGQLRFPEPHCPYCLKQTSGGKTYYYHHVLEAKIVTPEGLAISIGTEFIENSDPEASKQDCELKAFWRLAPRLKKDFPQLRLCLCLDNLYANGTVLALCEENYWKYFIVFKEGGQPALWEEYETLRDLSEQNRKTHQPCEGSQQTFAWVDDLPYTDSEGRTHQLRAFECREIDGEEKHFFAWLTNFHVGAHNVVALGNRGARCRWKIENQGFNIQKNGGFNLEHAYSIHEPQLKNFYLLLQIAHIILQLIERGSLLRESCQRLFGSLRALADRLKESLRHHAIGPEAFDRAALARLRIRLDGL